MKDKKETFKKVTKNQWILFFINVIYVLLFAIYFLSIKNYEFMIYIGVMIIFITAISYFHLKFNFSTQSLIGISLWGLMHMLGGSVYIKGTRLYDYILISIIPKYQILKYDQFVHFYCYVIITILCYEILKNYLNKDSNKYVLSLFLVFVGMGIGALNEIVEYLAVLIVPTTGVGDYTNTMLDIIFNTMGAILAVIYIRFRERK
ncbi:MAG: DUF2238 domain-containing protein [Candidatus Pacearchaeota archaeon]|jgi:putative membrane protein